MRKLTVFNQVTLDGYFSGPHGDISWAHKTPADAEWNTFVAENAGGGGVLLFGRVTYDLMRAYWPTAQALQNDPVDTYQFVLNPVLLGRGRTMFEGMTDPVHLKQTHTRTFGNGNVVLTYERV
jgi:dihydrofolate reductase